MSDIERLLRVVLDGQAFLYAAVMSIQTQIVTGMASTPEEFDAFRDEWAIETGKELELLKQIATVENDVDEQ